jgi:hypothetical protein
MWLCDSIKACPKGEQNNGVVVHLWICILQVGSSPPLGFDWFYVDGSVQDLRSSGAVSHLV